MARDIDRKGDFGLPRRLFESEQVVGIYDLVGFTQLPSNKDLVQAVSMLETSPGSRKRVPDAPPLRLRLGQPVSQQADRRQPQ